MKMLHKVWKKLIWVWNKCQGYEKSAWWYETNDKCSETNTHLKDAHIVLLTDFFRTVFVWVCFVPFRTVFVWCGFVLYHLYCFQVYSYTTGTTQYLFHNENGSKIVLCANNCRPQMELFCTIETFFVPQSDSIAHFMFQGSFFIPAGTKKVSLVRNPLESFESSEKLGG
jgi:hypothetical protein